MMLNALVLASGASRIPGFIIYISTAHLLVATSLIVELLVFVLMLVIIFQV